MSDLSLRLFWAVALWVTCGLLPIHDVAAQVYVRAGAGSGGGTLADPYGSLQDALAATSSGAIRVAEGTYLPSTSGDRSATFALKDDVTVEGGWAPDFSERDPAVYLTTLDGDVDGDGTSAGNAYHVASATGGVGPTAVLDGVTVRGGLADAVASGFDDSGAGLLVDGSSPTIRSVVFESNQAAGGGGGVACFNGGQPVIEGTAFSGNEATTIGGGGVSSFGCTLVLRTVSFTGNTGAAGGAITALTGSLTVGDATFTQNTAVDGGGAVFSDNAATVITGAAFDRNSESGTLGGGAIYVTGGSLRVGSGRFTGNVAATGSGGAVHVVGGAATTLTNVVFSANEAAQDGGAVFVDGATLDAVHLSSTANTGTEAYSVSAGGTATFQNAVVWNEAGPGFGGAGTIEIGAALIEGGLPAGATLLSGSPAVLNADPEYTDPTGPDATPGTADDDLRPSRLSPAVDAGLAGVLPADTDDLDGDGDTAEPLPVDVDGLPRLQDSSVRPVGEGNGGPDLGAHETRPTLAVFGIADDPPEDAALGDDAGWRIMAVPSPSTVADVADDVDFGALGLSGTPPTAMIYRWDDTAPNDTTTFTGNFDGLTSTADALPAGRGFLLFFFDDQLDPIRPDRPLVFDVPGMPPEDDLTISDLSTGALFHLLGNPYGRSFDISGLGIGGTSGFQAFVWVYDALTSAYRRVELGTAGDEVSPWQGFWVERSPSSSATTLTFDATARTTGAEFVGKSRRRDRIARIGLRLQVEQGGAVVASDEVLELSFRPEALREWDVWDATRPAPPADAGAGPTLSVRGMRGEAEVDKAHESRPFPLRFPLRLPLEIDPRGLAGTFRIDAPRWTNVPPGWTVRILDTQGTPQTRDDRTTRLTPDGEPFLFEVGEGGEIKAKGAGVRPGPSRTGGAASAAAKSAAGEPSAKFWSDLNARLYLTVAPGASARRGMPLFVRFVAGLIELRWAWIEKSEADGLLLVEHAAGDGPWAVLGPAGAAAKSGDGSAVLTFGDLAPGRHRFRLRVEGDVQPWSEEVEVEVPLAAAYEVRPPYPNPMRTEARVDVTVRESQVVRAELYDILGRRIATLHDGPMEPGRPHVLRINAVTSNLASGLYVLRITGEAFEETHRLSVVR